MRHKSHLNFLRRYFSTLATYVASAAGTHLVPNNGLSIPAARSFCSIIVCQQPFNLPFNLPLTSLIQAQTLWSLVQSSLMRRERLTSRSKASRICRPPSRSVSRSPVRAPTDAGPPGASLQ